MMPHRDKEKHREYMRNYMKNRYKNDEKFREMKKESIRNYQKNRYENDEKFREIKKECNKKYFLNIRMQIQALFGSKCSRCGETDSNVLTVNHIFSPKNPVYNGLKRRGWKLYNQILEKPEVQKYFNLLCATCQHLDKLEKQNYFSEKTSESAIYFRKRKEKICEMYGNKCAKCGKRFPSYLLTINHNNGGGKKDMQKRKRSMFKFPCKEIIEKLNTSEWSLRCWNCNANYQEFSKWTSLAKNNKKHLNNEKISDE